MKKLLYLLLLAATPSIAQVYKTKEPFAHTFSIVARDPATGEMAAAVQSHWFSVGTTVIYGKSGVGVVATQAFVDRTYGPLGLQLMEAGKTPQQALDELTAKDGGRDVRQVAFLNTTGETAVYTGKKCIIYAKDRHGLNYSTQSNMMLDSTVSAAMEDAYLKNDKLPLAERMIACLKAGQAAGGDIRGQQSAAIIVVSGKPATQVWNDKLIDLRVEDSKDPITELERLLKVHRAYEHMNTGDLYLEKNNMPAAMAEYTAAEKMFPDNLEMKYWHAITLANNKKVKEAAIMLQQVYKLDAHYRELTRRLPASDQLSVTPAELKLLLR